MNMHQNVTIFLKMYFFTNSLIVFQLQPNELKNERSLFSFFMPTKFISMIKIVISFYLDFIYFSYKYYSFHYISR